MALMSAMVQLQLPAVEVVGVLLQAPPRLGHAGRGLLMEELPRLLRLQQVLGLQLDKDTAHVPPAAGMPWAAMVLEPVGEQV